MKNTINKIANYFGYELITDIKYLDLTTTIEQKESQIVTLLKEKGNLLKSFQALERSFTAQENQLKKYIACEITPKKDVLALFDILRKHNYSKIFEANFQNCRIYAFATMTKLLWFEINKDGEIMTVLKQINENDRNVLIEKLTVENASLVNAKRILKGCIGVLQARIKDYTIKSEMENTQEFYDLTPKEKDLITILNGVLEDMKQADVKLREVEI